MSSVLIFVIRGYQITIGKLLPRVCRFEPTCSTYAIDAFREHGFFRGMGLSLWRLLRCNPFCAGGVDPVPRRSCDHG
jgi:putative membrane protein insertion efficiency factor